MGHAPISVYKYGYKEHYAISKEKYSFGVIYLFILR